MTGTVIAVSISPNHFFSKSNQNKIKLVAGIGIEGDAQAGNILRKAGIMSIVISSGVVCPGDRIRIELPPQPYRALEKV